jgi:hypothetical protein
VIKLKLAISEFDLCHSLKIKFLSPKKVNDCLSIYRCEIDEAHLSNSNLESLNDKLVNLVGCNSGLAVINVISINLKCIKQFSFFRVKFLKPFIFGMKNKKKHLLQKHPCQKAGMRNIY